jgi:hypothetical protein
MWRARRAGRRTDGGVGGNRDRERGRMLIGALFEVLTTEEYEGGCSSGIARRDEPEVSKVDCNVD